MWSLSSRPRVKTHKILNPENPKLNPTNKIPNSILKPLNTQQTKRFALDVTPISAAKADAHGRNAHALQQRAATDAILSRKIESAHVSDPQLVCPAIRMLIRARRCAYDD